MRGDDSQRLVFVGDSLIEFFDWQSRFPGHTVSNLGRSGETVQELLRRVSHVVHSVEQPDWLIIMSGINNVAMEDFSFLPAYGELLHRFQEGFPNTKVAPCSLLPVRLPWVAPTALVKLNQRLQEMAEQKRCAFFDIHDLFLGSDGLADPQFLLEDGVHLSDAGYGHWAELVGELIRSH